MPNSLVTPDDLDVFPGAPFSERAVDIAAGSVRAEARWHIAPVQTQTLRLEWAGSKQFLVLPTLRLLEVTEIRDVTTVPLIVTGWTQAGMSTLYRWTGWQSGVYEIDMTHGYDETPMDLLPVIVSRIRNLSNPRDPGLASQAVTRGPFTKQESYRGDAPTRDPVVARYSLPPGVA